MKILAINGSHRKGRNTAALLGAVLSECAKLGAETELVELTDYSIKFCTSCNRCLRRTKCSIEGDDMPLLEAKLMEADAILLGSPVYFSNVTAIMKNFMDRTRYMHMVKNQLADKVGAAVTNAGLRHGGQEMALQIMEGFLKSHGLLIVSPRIAENAISEASVAGSLVKEYKDGKPVMQNTPTEDEGVAAACRDLAYNMVMLVKKLS